MKRRAVVPPAAVMLAIQLGAIAGGAAPVAIPVTEITIDLFCRRSIGGISELKRATYFGLCDPSTAFDARCRPPERYEYLRGENGITFGRRLGVVRGLGASLREDPRRPGFADLNYLQDKLRARRVEPSECFKHDSGGRLEVAAHGDLTFQCRRRQHRGEEKCDPVSSNCAHTLPVHQPVSRSATRRRATIKNPHLLGRFEEINPFRLTLFSENFSEASPLTKRRLGKRGYRITDHEHPREITLVGM